MIGRVVGMWGRRHVAGSLGLGRRAWSTLPPLAKVDVPKGYLDEPAAVPLARSEGKDYKFTEYPSLKHYYRLSLPELLEELSGIDVPGAMEEVKTMLAQLEQRDDLDAQEAFELEQYRKAFQEMKAVETEEGMQEAMLTANFEHTALEVSKEMTFENRFRLMLYNLLVTGQEFGRASTKANDLKTLYGELRKTTAAAKQPATAEYRKPLPSDRYETCGDVLAAFLHASLPGESIGQNWTMHVPKSERVQYYHWNDTVHLPFGHTMVPMRTWSEDQIREVHINFHYRMMVLCAGAAHSAASETFIRVPAPWLLAFKRHRWPGVEDEDTTFWHAEDLSDADLIYSNLYSDVLPLRADMSSAQKAVPFPLRRNHPMVRFMKSDE